MQEIVKELLQHRERSHLAQKLAEMHLRDRLPASKQGPCLYSYDELGVADGKAGREPLPGAARFFHHITVLGKGHLLLRCKILRRPLDFPAGVVYSKGNFILNKTLRQTYMLERAKERTAAEFGVVQAVLQAGSTVTTAECEGEPSPG